MFCKDCGDRIDKTGRCIRCGKPVGPLEGGIGFWDLAGKARTGGTNPDIKPPAVSINTAKMEKLISEGTERLDKGMNHIYRRQALVNRSQMVILTVIALLLAVSVFLDIWLLWTVRDIRSAIPADTTMDSTAATEMAIATENIAETESETEAATIVPTGSTEPETEGTLAESLPNNWESISKQIEIVKHPSSEEVNENTANDTLLFTTEAHADGRKLSFKWKKKDDFDGQWKSIDETTLEAYLRSECVVEDGKYSFKLFLKKYNSDVLGAYICEITVEGAEGYPQYTDPAILKQKAAEVWPTDPDGWNG